MYIYDIHSIILLVLLTMFHTTHPRRVLKLAEKKSEKHTIPLVRKSFRNQSKTFSGYGQKCTSLKTQKPRSMTVSGLSNISIRNRSSIQLVRNFEITCKGLEYCGDSYQCLDKMEEASNNYFPHQSSGEQNSITKEARGEVIRRQVHVTVLGSPKVGKTSLIQRLRRLGNISTINTYGGKYLMLTPPPPPDVEYGRWVNIVLVCLSPRFIIYPQIFWS